MMKNLLLLCLLTTLLTGCQSDENPASKTPDKTTGRSVVEIQTNYGLILIELFDDITPQTVNNFMQHVEEHFYDDTLVHQVFPGFIIQAGCFDQDFQLKESGLPITNEASQSHSRGTVAMMRDNHPDSAKTEFFINLKDNDLFDIPNGYAVFGHVIDGFDVLDKISELPTCAHDPFYDDVPCETVLIEKVVRMS